MALNNTGIYNSALGDSAMYNNSSGGLRYADFVVSLVKAVQEQQQLIEQLQQKVESLEKALVAIAGKLVSSR